LNAPPAVQLRLLDLQELDAGLDRLAHRRRTLPELAEIDRLDTRLGELRDEIVVAETQASDVEREQRKIENDVDVVRGRMTRDQQRLDAGSVSSAKELENLQHELGSLARRQGDLEELVLEQMERQEEIESRLSVLRRERDSLTESLAAAVSRRDETFAALDAEAGSLTAARAALIGEIVPDLLALYEKIRASSGGQGAAALDHGRCEGCHLTLSPLDLDRFRSAPEDEVLRCEECRRILVRR
jgi:predicted  nucleic acid-binding Zn-ribbon protein